MKNLAENSKMTVLEYSKIYLFTSLKEIDREKKKRVMSAISERKKQIEKEEEKEEQLSMLRESQYE